jgi:hypothetical protein
MPTVGWILEDTVERFWEGQPRPDPVKSPHLVFVCKWCAREFSSPKALHHHFSLEHPLELPALYVHGEPLLRESVLRAPVRESDVDLLHCTHCEVQIDGGPWNRLTLPEFRTQFAQPTNSTWNVRLVHERSEDDSRTEEEYHVRFRIPDTTVLNALDEHFLQTLVLDELRHSDLTRFEAGLPVDVPAREYGGALGNYALGILLKERHNRPRSQVGFEEFAVKMRSALEVLRLFNRPVALAVSSSIRFNLNDFHDYGTAIAMELETGLRFFRSIIGGSTTDESPSLVVMPAPQKASKRAVCPVDQVSHRLLDACARLSGGGRMSLTELEAIRQHTRGMIPVSEQDLAKIHVICAEGYMRCTRAADALLHLQAIQFDPSFKDWAQRRLENM